MNIQREVVILRGASGIGKSEWAAARKAENPSVIVVSAADFFETPDGYKFNPAQLPASHDACLRLFIHALRNEAPCIIVDNTNTEAWEISPYLALARLHGYTVKIRHFTPEGIPRVEAAKLLAARSKHKVPARSIGSMLLRLDQFLPRSFPPETLQYNDISILSPSTRA